MKQNPNPARSAIAFLLLLSAGLTHAACPVPTFEEFKPRPTVPVTASAKQRPHVEINMQPFAGIDIPGGFTRVGTFEHGGMIFSGNAESVSVALGYENGQTMALYAGDAQPAPFMLATFKGQGDKACRYLQGFNLEREEYRLHARVAPDGELYAFGKGNRHQFYLIRGGQPERVLSGTVRNVSRTEFESMLATLKIK